MDKNRISNGRRDEKAPTQLRQDERMMVGGILWSSFTAHCLVFARDFSITQFINSPRGNYPVNIFRFQFPFVY
jgi:hypothetical protein